MKNERVAGYYNELYARDPNAFKRDPLPLVSVLTQYIQTGTVLDIGAGQGDNSIFLASKGFDVQAWDISEKAVELLRHRAAEARVSLSAQVCDVVDAIWMGEYDVIVCTFTLHHMSSDDALSVIANMQKHTRQDGFNIIATFSKEGDLYTNTPHENRFFVDNKAQMETLYQGWSVLKSFEKDASVRARGINGEQQRNVFVGMLAQKVDKN
ncbi:MAG: methyltransferase domain-containing protein [Nitrososphaera sp.]|nr:methyltransferase domain-containing protein [Nitrososphaera sp.]